MGKKKTSLVAGPLRAEHSRMLKTLVDDQVQQIRDLTDHELAVMVLRGFPALGDLDHKQIEEKYSEYLNTYGPPAGGPDYDTRDKEGGE